MSHACVFLLLPHYKTFVATVVAFDVAAAQ